MNRQDWESIGKALGDLRAKVDASWPPKGGFMANSPDIHDRKLIHGAKLQAIDETAREICHVLKARSSRFDGARFLRMVGVRRKG